MIRIVIDKFTNELKCNQKLLASIRYTIQVKDVHIMLHKITISYILEN